MTEMCWKYLEDANPGLLAYTMRIRPECSSKVRTRCMSSWRWRSRWRRLKKAREKVMSEQKIVTVDKKRAFVGRAGCKKNDNEIVELIIDRQHFVFYPANATALRDALTEALGEG